jgi:hypothetical protein
MRRRRFDSAHAPHIQCLTEDLVTASPSPRKLQIVKLTPVKPQKPVELHVVCASPGPTSSPVHFFPDQILEELEDRLGNCMSEVTLKCWVS